MGDFEIWTDWLSSVPGIGPRLGGLLISNISIKFKRVSSANMKKLTKAFEDETIGAVAIDVEDLPGVVTREQWTLALKTKGGDYLLPFKRGIGAFATVSKLWKFFGIHVKEDGWSPKRVKGKNLDWSPKLRTLQWKIGQQFIKLPGTYYNAVYAVRRLLELNKRITYEILVNEKGKSRIKLLGVICPREKECRQRIADAMMRRAGKKANPATVNINCINHCTMMASRYAVKKFLSHLWERWRVMEGLPVRPVYILEHGHTTHEPVPEFDDKATYVDGKLWTPPSLPTDAVEPDEEQEEEPDELYDDSYDDEEPDEEEPDNV